tara:strand:- start:47 stop:508 length:462 start_codon:yes stop_codon:yes gene_type:complete
MTEIIQHQAGNLINPRYINEKGQLSIPENTSREEWAQIHSQLTAIKHLAKKWHKESRHFGLAKFGDEFVAVIEAQQEFDLGLPNDAPKQETLNPSDKSRVFVSIEGINQQYVMWERKMGDEIQTWDGDKCKRALEFLEPMESMAAKLRSQLNK